MNRQNALAKYLAPTKYVPVELRESRVGNVRMGAPDIARVIVAKFAKHKRNTPYHVLLDIDGSVYAVRKGLVIDDIIERHPHILVGVYDRNVDVADLAGDIEALGRGA